ncbi:MAG TPA: HD-GYP domain-containing protein [Clostridia bacterium]|nr:HD-GYP domain-containing protein [Clostridia bacterium]
MAERMIEVNVAELLPGDILAADIYSTSGNTLAKKNTVISDNTILGLKKNHIESVYIFRDLGYSNSEDLLNIKDILIKEAIEIMDTQVMKFIKKEKNIYELKDIIIDLLKKDKIINLMIPLRVIGDNIFRHCISVAFYSVAVGKEMYFPINRLFILGTAALLHDVGMTEIPRNIVNKKGSLTELEKMMIQRHPRYSFEIVQNAGGFSAEIYNIILEHHERYDGTGYPGGLVNDKIHTMAKIIAVCDVYEALTSDRPYRSKHTRSESVEYLLGSGNFYFNHEIVKALINTIVIYRYGQWVELSTKEIGVVIDDEVQGFNIKPKVMVYFNVEGRQLREPKLVDLSLRESINISILRNI